LIKYIVEIVFIVAAVVLVVLFFIQGAKVLKQEKASRKWYQLTSFRYLLIICVVGVSSFIYAYGFTSAPDRSTSDLNLKWTQKFHRYGMEYNEYQRMMLNDTSNLDLNYLHVCKFRAFVNSLDHPDGVDKIWWDRTSGWITDYYERLLHSEDSAMVEIANLCLANHYLTLNSTNYCDRHLVQLTDKSSGYYFLTKGANNLNSGAYSQINQAEADLRMAQTLGQDSAATNELAKLYYYFHENDKLNNLCLENVSNDYIDSYLVQINGFKQFHLFDYWKEIFTRETESISIIGFCSALLILLLWLFYLRQVDIYEPEKWKYLFMVFGMGCLCLFLIYPMGDFLRMNLYLFQSPNPAKGLLHDIVSIGLLEELVKIIPVLIMIKFTKAVNEPIDYIVYSCVSALAFSFVENIGYIEYHETYNIAGRGFASAVSHMALTSIIGYGLMLSKYGKFSKPGFYFFFTLILAAIAHGLYDFWLINEWAVQYSWVTNIIMVILFHLLFTFLNNAQNISNFFNPQKKINNVNLRLYLFTGLFGIMMYDFVVNATIYGFDWGFDHLKNTGWAYGYFLFYLAMDLTNFSIKRGYIRKLNLPFLFLIPRIKKFPKTEGLAISLHTSKRLLFLPEYQHLALAFPLKGWLAQRVWIDGSDEGYLVALDQDIEVEGKLSNTILVLPKNEREKVTDPDQVVCHVMLLPEKINMDAPILWKNHFTMAGWIVAKTSKA
jgi:RsiW-degrading membrane proteinase PrsW (M82 family)